jgi:hypothetical protein
MRLLFLTSPELRGTDVHALQQRLRELGLKPGPVDGYYGPATAAAVRDFQRIRALKVAGIVGVATVRELVEAPSHPIVLEGKKPTLSGRPAPGLLALEWMEQHVGEKEAPPYSNRCSTTKEFGLVGPWCAMDVSLAFKHGANLILGDGPGPAAWGFWPGRGFAAVLALEAWCKTRGYWRGRTTPAPGMLAFYNFGPIKPGHVGIVKRYLGGGQFIALEGNTGIGADADGGERMERTRYVSDVAGFAYVSWEHP